MEQNQTLLDLQVDSELSSNLNQVSRWSKTLAIVVISGIGLFFLLIFALWSTFAGLFSTLSPGGEVSGNAVMIILTIVFALVFALVVVLMMFLIKGAAHIRNGISNRDQYTFNRGLNNLKNYFVMYGVLGIIGILFALLGILAR